MFMQYSQRNENSIQKLFNRQDVLIIQIESKMVYCLSWNIFDKELLSAASHDSDYERKTIIIISPFQEQSRFIKDIIHK